ncbi:MULTISPECIES: DUF58 domain-containing protein [Allobacillus]|nr:DUF58 domain-containing protein [Allobacillus salarius]
MSFHKSILEISIFRTLTVVAVLLLFGGLVISAFGHAFLLLFLAILIVAIYGLGKFYEKHVDDFLEVTVAQRQQRVDPGGTGSIEVVIRQKGILPLLMAKISMEMDHAIELSGGKMHRRRERTFVEKPFSLQFWEEKTIEFPYTAKQRGVSQIRSLEIILPNPFNLNQIYLKLDDLNLTEVVVFPKKKAVHHLQHVQPKGKGEHVTQQSLYIDRSRNIGTRPYEFGDPFNQIHWKASARTGEFHVKVDERVSHLSRMFLINVKLTRNNREAFEEMVEQVAYLAMDATKKGIPYSLYINILSMNRVPFIHQAEGKGEKHLGNTLELLARIQGGTFTVPFENMLNQIILKEPLATDVIQAGMNHPDYDDYYRMFEQKGSRVHHLQTDESQEKGVAADGSFA